MQISACAKQKQTHRYTNELLVDKREGEWDGGTN